MRQSESGNVLFIILIAIALFGALIYAVSGDRTSVKDKSGEQQKLDQAVIDNYLTCLNQGRMTLGIARMCDNINYDPPSEWSGSNFKCHMFHPQGAGCAYVDLGNACANQGGDLTELAIGEECGGIVYAGVSGGNRIYTTLTNLGAMTWTTGGVTNYPDTGASSTSDGLSNTNTLLNSSVTGSPFLAAVACRSLGEDWYLPAKDELNLLYQNRNEGELSGTFHLNWQWTSTQYATPGIWIQRFSDGLQGGNNGDAPLVVRCVRRD